MKRGRRLKSCAACRKSKNRCDLPSPSSVRPSLGPQPTELACHRCRTLGMGCIVAQELPPPSQSKRQRRPKAYQADGLHHANGRPSASTSRTDSMPAADLQLFDVDHGEEDQESADVLLSLSRSDLSNSRRRREESRKQRPWIDRATSSIRPFEVLRVMCLHYSDFWLARPQTEGVTRHVEMRGTDDVQWPLHVSLFLPFLGLEGPSHVWQHCKSHLRNTTTGRPSTQGLSSLRASALSCLVNGPAAVEDAAAMIVIAFYEPLILAHDAYDASFEGLGFLSSAVSYLRPLCASLFATCRALARDEMPMEPTLYPQMLQVALLILTTATQTKLFGLSGRLPVTEELGVSLDDVEVITQLCKRYGAFAPQESLLMRISAHRYRITSNIHDILVAQVAILEARRATAWHHQLYAETVSALLWQVDAAYAALRVLQQDIFDKLTEGQPDDVSLCFDWLYLEIQQLHLFASTRLQEVLATTTSAHLGESDSYAAFVREILQRPGIRETNGLIGETRFEAGEQFATLFHNICTFELADQPATLIPPPMQTCASALLAVDALVKGTLAKVSLGHALPTVTSLHRQNRAAMLCGNVFSALATLSKLEEMRGCASLEQQRGHRDIFSVSAAACRRSVTAILRWISFARRAQPAEDTDVDIARRSQQQTGTGQGRNVNPSPPYPSQQPMTQPPMAADGGHLPPDDNAPDAQAVLFDFGIFDSAIPAIFDKMFGFTSQ